MTPREYLFSLEHHGVKLGLETIEYLLDSAGRPERLYPKVHIAGTNGKGSVSAFLYSILRAAGYRTGRFTSPHLIDINERFYVNGAAISDDELDNQIDFFRTIAEARHWWPPTFFEVNTAVALRWFAQCDVDCAVVEVGLGGRFDATNIIVPRVAAITNIDYDHMRYLGDTIAEIAFEKGGIIKSGRPLVVGETKPDALDVIVARAADMDAPVSLAHRDFSYDVNGPSTALTLDYRGRFKLDNAPLGLVGRFQGENAAVAVALAEALAAESFSDIGADAVTAGLESARWPCRLEKVLDDPPVIIDVAHNPAGARKLAAEVADCITIMAVSRDKAADKMIQALAPVSHTLILTQFSGHRALPVERLSSAARAHPHRCIPTLDAAIAEGVETASASHPLVITGSVFTAGEARGLLVDKYGAAPPAF